MKKKKFQILIYLEIFISRKYPAGNIQNKAIIESLAFIVSFCIRVFIWVF